VCVFSRRKSEEIATTAIHTTPRRQIPLLGLKSLTLGDKPSSQSPTNKKGGECVLLGIVMGNIIVFVSVSIMMFCYCDINYVYKKSLYHKSQSVSTIRSKLCHRVSA